MVVLSYQDEARGVVVEDDGGGGRFTGVVLRPKVVVADDTVFIGSFNLSHSGETNAENVLEIADAALAERMAGFVDSIRVRYPALTLD